MSAAAAAASAGAGVAACTGAEGGFFFFSSGSGPAGPMGPEEGSAGGLGALPGALAPPSLGCRSRYQLLLSGKALADRYRKIYTAALSDRELGSHPGRLLNFTCIVTASMTAPSLHAPDRFFLV